MKHCLELRFITLAVALDMSKMFDTVNKHKLMHKLTLTNISNITLVNTQIFATDIILILGYIRCVDFENDIHFC